MGSAPSHGQDVGSTFKRGDPGGGWRKALYRHLQRHRQPVKALALDQGEILQSAQVIENAFRGGRRFAARGKVNRKVPHYAAADELHPFLDTLQNRSEEHTSELQ